MARAFAEIAFTENVRDIQTRQGSADGYQKFLAPGHTTGGRLSVDEAEFIARRDGFYQASVSETGWPYVQFRGGPAGFLKVLDDQTIAYADFRGNRQYISAGNLTGNDRISLILMDYPNRRRLKLWGRVAFDDDPDLIELLHPKGYRARPERAVKISVAAYDWNCPQHIPQRLTAEEFAPQVADLHHQIATLQAENDSLRQQASVSV